MKLTKLIYILFVIFIITFVCINVKGETDNIIEDDSQNLYVFKDSNLNADFTSANVTSFNTNVNIAKSGNYKMYYTTKNIEYNRNVIVRSEEEYDQGIGIINEILDIYFYHEEYIITSYTFNKISDQSYLCIINYNQQGVNFSYVCIIENNFINKHLDLLKTSVTSSIIDGNNIYLFITSYNTIKSISVQKYDLELNILDENKIEANNQTVSKEMYLKEEYLYLSFETRMNEGLIKRAKSNNVITLAKLNLDSFLIENYQIFGNNYDNSLVKFYYDESFYLYLDLKGSSGDYYNAIDKSYTSRMIIEINDSLKVVSKTPISKAYNLYDLYIENDKYYLIINENEYHKIIRLSSDISSTSLTSYTYNYDEGIDDFLYTYYQGKIICLLNDNYRLIKIQYIYDDNTIYEDLNQELNSLDDIKIIDNEIYFVNNIDGFYYLNKYEKINITKYLEKEENYTKEKIKFYINDELIDLYYIDSSLNNLSFGTYVKQAKAISNYGIIIYKMKVTSPLQTNVYDNMIVDQNTTITFNATSYLNGIKIESPYVLKDIGTYQLEIYGENNAYTSYNFEVREMSEKSINLDSLNYHNLTYKSDLFIDKEIKEESKINYEYNKSDIKSYASYIIIVLISLMSIFYFYDRRKHV